MLFFIVFVFVFVLVFVNVFVLVFVRSFVFVFNDILPVHAILETLDTLANAVHELRNLLAAEEQQNDQQDDNNLGCANKEKWDIHNDVFIVGEQVLLIINK